MVSGCCPKLRAEPLGTLVSLLQNALTSFWTVGILAWLQIISFPDLALYGFRTLLVYAAVMIVIALAVWAWAWAHKENPAIDRRAWWLVALGALMLPVCQCAILVDRPAGGAGLSCQPVHAAFHASGGIDPGRVDGIGSPGCDWLPLLLALVIGLAAGRQFLWGVDFSHDWEAQKDLFWQMTWRAPGLQPGTMVLLNEGALRFYADNSLSAALNWIYAPDIKANGNIPYLLFHPTNRLEGTLPDLQPGRAVDYDYLAGRFQGSTSQVVSFYYLPPACLRTLDPVIDVNNHFIPDRYLMREGAALSSTEWIEAETGSRMPAVYGPEPAHGWCYYFEKADLARQQGDWTQVASLGDRAFSLGDHPNDPSERFVFIEGYAHTGDWKKAVNYSLDSHRVSPKYVDPMLCLLWQRIESQTTASPAMGEALAEIKTKIACSGE